MKKNLKRITDNILITSFGCWNYKSCNSSGYGRIQIDGQFYYVHRLIYEIFKGPIPENFQIDHLCRNRRCCNPEHLEAVTRKENILRGTAPSAKNALKQFCKRGHPLIEENLAPFEFAQGIRRCKICQYSLRKQRSKK